MTARDRTAPGEKDGLRFPLGLPPWFALAALLGAALRVALWLQYRRTPFSRSLIGDEHNYWSWVQEIVHGGWVPQEAFYQGPLYPYLLAAASTVFPGLAPASLAAVQLALNWVTALLVVPLARRHVGERAALAAGVLALFLAPAAFTGLKGVPTTLGLFLLTCALLALGGGGRGGAWRGGALMGLAILDSPSFMLLLLAVPAWLLATRPRGDRLLPPFVFLAAAGLCILPVSVLNYTRSGSLILVSSSYGVVFAQGNGPASRGSYTKLPGLSEFVGRERDDVAAVAQREAGRPLSPGEVSRHYLGKGLAFIAEDPRRWLALMGRKTLLLLSGLDIPLEFSLARERRDFLPVLWLFPVGGSAVVGLAALGLAALGLQGGDAPRRILLPCLGALALGTTCLIFYVANRYVLPVLFLLLPAAGQGVLVLPRLPSRPALLAALLPLGLGLAFTLPFLDDARWETRDYLPKLASAYAELGDPAGVERTFRRWEAREPGSPALLENRAHFAAARGDLAGAAALARAAASASGGSRESLLLLARLLAPLGAHGEAGDILARLLARDPADEEARLALAELYLGTGDETRAEAELRSALAAAPLSPRVRERYAWFLLGRGDLASARREFVEALRVAPRFAAARFGHGVALADEGRYREALGELRLAEALGFPVPSWAWEKIPSSLRPPGGAP